jgi:ankyrin repeat protein
MIVIVVALTGITVRAQENPDKFYSALRAGDLVALKALLDQGVSPDSPDSRGVTPLMNAAAVGSVEAMKMLIDRGADVNAQNTFGSTALMWSAHDPAKARLLLDHGADVNKTTKLGRSALMIAALSNHSSDLVRQLLAKGADPSQKDSQGFTAFLSAISSNDTETIRLLSNYAGNVNEPNGFTGILPLMTAAGMRNIALVKMLMAKGADVNAPSQYENIPTFKVKNGTIALGAITPLMMSATYGPPEMVKTLLDAGAKINVKDIRGMTPLMMAVTSDRLDPAVVKMLLERGADTGVKSTVGETAIDWALKFGQSDAVGALGGKPKPQQALAIGDVKQDPRAALQRSIGLLETASATFFVKSGCNACHAQGPTHFAAAAAKAKGITTDEKLAAERVQQMLSTLPPAPIIMERPAGFLGGDGFFYALEGLGRSGFAPNRITDIMAVEIAKEQWEDGGWHGDFGNARTPLQDGNVSRTAMALRVLKNYGTPARAAENKERIQRARQWLLNARMFVTEDYDTRLLGVASAGASHDELAKLSEPILKRQRADGGWAQRDELNSDAYATGMTLSVLAETGVLATSSTVFKNGIKFLLSTQAVDGSWHVASRAAKFQPYFEGGFPYGHDQWISSNATAWAANALALGLDRPSASAQR